MTELLAITTATLARAVTIGCGLIFLTAASQKLRHRRLLPGVIANYRILPQFMVSPASAGLPIVEIVLGLALLAGLGSAAPVAAAILMTVFAAAMAINLKRGRRHISCGCGRPDLSQELRWSMVVRNLMLAAALLVAAASFTPLGVIEHASAAFAAAALWIGWYLFEAIAALNANLVALRWRS
jgi:Methylamine utilisation protein MauE.